MKKISWFNGQYLADDFVTLSTTNHSWLRGDGLFETLRTDGDRIYFLNRHLARAQKSADAIFLSLPYSSNLDAICQEVVKKTALEGSGKLRLTFFANGDFLITHEEYRKTDLPISLGVFPDRKPAGFLLNSVKSLSYGYSAAALRWSVQSGYEDSLLINESDQVIESGMANVALDLDGAIVFPDLSSGGLPGVVREVALEWFPKIVVRSVDLDELGHIQGMALLSSLREYQQVGSLQGKSLPISEKLMALAGEFRNRAQAAPDS